MSKCILICATTLLLAACAEDKDSAAIYATCERQTDVALVDYGSGDLKSEEYYCEDVDGTFCTYYHWVNDSSVNMTSCSGSIHL